MVLDISPDRLVTIISPEHGLQQIQAGSVILAMGCRERPRGALAIPGTNCAGIMTTGTAQRLVNLESLVPGKRIVILGSGDIGLIMARRMTCIGAKVLACVEIMPYSSGLTRNVVQCLHDYNIPLLLNHTVIDIKGRERLTGVTIAAVDPATRRPVAGTEQEIACDTLLLSVGLIPENELSRAAGVSLSDVTQGPLVDQNLLTSVPGIFACGNVLHVHDLVDEVSDESARAGLAAVAWLEQIKAGSQAAAVRPLMPPIRLIDGRGVRGIVPQQITRPLNQDKIHISFRPDGVYKQATILVEADGETVLRQKRLIMTPGEMAVIDLATDRFSVGTTEAITVHVEVKA
jgi:sarcosine oxidase subunit alpha